MARPVGSKNKVPNLSPIPEVTPRQERERAKGIIAEIEALEAKLKGDDSAVMYTAGRMDDLRGVIQQPGMVYAKCGEMDKKPGRQNYYRMLSEGWKPATLPNGEKADWENQRFAIMERSEDIQKLVDLHQQRRTMEANGTLYGPKRTQQVEEEGLSGTETTKRGGVSMEDLGISLEQ